jgi:hypothetical protein
MARTEEGTRSAPQERRGSAVTDGQTASPSRDGPDQRLLRTFSISSALLQFGFNPAFDTSFHWTAPTVMRNVENRMGRIVAIVAGKVDSRKELARR